MPGGTGVGLTVASELAHANGCRLVVETTGSSGTTFRLEVPLLVS
jgi:signal transduction histidine kinase